MSLRHSPKAMLLWQLIFFFWTLHTAAKTQNPTFRICGWLRESGREKMCETAGTLAPFPSLKGNMHQPWRVQDKYIGLKSIYTPRRQQRRNYLSLKVRDTWRLSVNLWSTTQRESVTKAVCVITPGDDLSPSYERAGRTGPDWVGHQLNIPVNANEPTPKLIRWTCAASSNVSRDSRQRDWQMQRGRPCSFAAGGSIHGAPASPLTVKVSSLSSNDGQGFLMGTEREREAEKILQERRNLLEVLKLSLARVLFSFFFLN